jgi:hypothetical protein
MGQLNNNGKITVNSVLTAQSTQIFSFTILTYRIRFYHKHDKHREVSHLFNGYLHSLVR